MDLQSFGDTLVVAPHPDDETLGCGAVLLRLATETNHRCSWCIVTRMTSDAGYDEATIACRDQEIRTVSQAYGFSSVHQLPFVAATLDETPTGKLISAMADVFEAVRPQTVLLPFPNDAHSDHRRTFAIASAGLKWFRRPHVQRILCYEVPSETGFNYDPTAARFVPNVYIRSTREYLNKKINIMRTYANEMQEFPFPRSAEAIDALARWRGSECGAEAAEAFALVREVI